MKVIECATGIAHDVQKMFSVGGTSITVHCMIHHTYVVGQTLDDAVELEAALPATGGGGLKLEKKVEIADDFDYYDFMCWHTLPLTRNNLLAMLALGYEPAPEVVEACSGLMPSNEELSKAKKTVAAAVEEKRKVFWEEDRVRMLTATEPKPKTG